MNTSSTSSSPNKLKKAQNKQGLQIDLADETPRNNERLYSLNSKHTVAQGNLLPFVFPKLSHFIYTSKWSRCSKYFQGKGRLHDLQTTYFCLETFTGKDCLWCTLNTEMQNHRNGRQWAKQPRHFSRQSSKKNILKSYVWWL